MFLKRRNNLLKSRVILLNLCFAWLKSRNNFLFCCMLLLKMRLHKIKSRFAVKRL